MSAGFYRAFEDRYRGSREVISERLRVYLPFVQPLVADGAAALDLGCGRGEWLELLDKAGFAAEGVDLDEGMLAACRERGLHAVNGDALDVLRARPDSSLAVVSAFHLIEHIPFEQVQTLIAEALRVLQPGGVLILETPNPENLVVGTSSFYDDPSHLKPVSPKLLAFAIEFTGFSRHTILRLQEPERLREATDVALFDVLSGVSPDYSVVAQKAGAPAHTAQLDAQFEASLGLDLHTLAQRYQQRQDAVRGDLDGLREQQASSSLSAQQQLATIDSQIAQVHGSTVALVEQLAQLASTDAALEQRLIQAETERPEVVNRIDAIDAKVQRIDVIETKIQRIDTIETSVQRIDGIETSIHRIDDVEANVQTLSQAVAQATNQNVTARLRTRIVELEESQGQAIAESARLAAHVAWIEGRLTHAESEAAALRHQLGELLRPRNGLGMRIGRALRHGPRLVAGVLSTQRLRQPASALLRRLIQAVMRRPALKRTARSLVARFPRLHTRLLQLMYAPALPGDVQQVDADPMASDMSPRSLSIYRALIAASKPKD